MSVVKQNCNVKTILYPKTRAGSLASYKINRVIQKESRSRGFLKHPNGSIIDHTWIEHNGQWHVFYIHAERRSVKGSYHDVDVGHASTADFIHWAIHKPAPVEGAPSIIRKDGLFYLFSNRRARRDESPGIILATSPDLESWTVHDKFPVYVPDSKYYGWPDFKHCRDYHVMPFEDGYLLLFAETIRKTGHGCIGAIRSENLVDWEDMGPLFVLDKTGWGFTHWSVVGYGVPESPCLFSHDGRWHLLFTDNLVHRTYRLWADKPFGDWSWGRSAYFHGSPIGWDMDTEPGEPALGICCPSGTAAVELFQTKFGWMTSYYFHDLVEKARVLRVEPVKWHDGHPFILPWPVGMVEK